MTAPEVAVHGTVEPGFEGVLAAFEENFATHGDVGASVAVTIGGRMVVDLWGGTASFDGPDDDEAGVPGVEGDWQQDTIINVMSTTKTMAALVCLMLADRGELDLYEPIASYWPEFAANGKDRIATRHVLSHTAGLAGWDEPLDETDFFDHDKLVRLLAAQAPWWEPGTQSGYHADTHAMPAAKEVPAMPMPSPSQTAWLYVSILPSRKVGIAVTISSSIIMFRPPMRSVKMPTGTRRKEPVRIGIAASSANSPSLSPNSFFIVTPMIENITQTAKNSVNRVVAIIRTRTASGLAGSLLAARVARGWIGWTASAASRLGVWDDMNLREMSVLVRTIVVQARYYLCGTVSDVVSELCRRGQLS